MHAPLQVTFRHMDCSPALESRIYEHATRLERLFPVITHCRVVVEVPPAHKNKGAPFEISIELSVPKRQIVVNSERAKHPEHVNAHVAVRDAFRNARRLLEDYTQLRRRDVKYHAVEDAPVMSGPA
jgi:ribosome-associated translation inhibitor RaiA